MEKPLKILVYADFYGDKLYQNSAYIEFLSQFGEVIPVSSINNLSFWTREADVLCLPGGADVDPARYNEKPSSKHTRINPHYEYLDAVLLAGWLETKKPIIGICRGMQTLNVALGGTLHQHIHGHIGGTDRSKTDQVLFTDIFGDGLDYRIYKTNSYHHQAVKQVANGFKVIGWSPVYDKCKTFSEQDKKYPKLRQKYVKNKQTGETLKTKDYWYYFPEIMVHETLPYLAFQYHPEEFNCELAILLINKLLGTDVKVTRELEEAKA